MPDIAKAFPSKYLKASDIGEAQPVVTISHVDFEEVGQKREVRPILHFVGKEKAIVLNKINSIKITALLGTGITEEWEGQKIRLYVTETTFGGDTVECIRIKAATPNGKDKIAGAKKRRSEPEPDDDIISGDEDPDSVPF